VKQTMTKRFFVQIPDQRWFEDNVGCENACPVNTRAPQYISAIVKENFAQAFEINRGDNLFPAILGRICVHPCEEKCRRGHLIDLPISICSLKRASADHKADSQKTETIAGKRDKKEKTFIQRLEGGFLAFSAICPHLRCIVNWNEMLKKFECPCHATGFDPEKRTYKEENVGCEACHGPGEKYQEMMMGKDALEGGKIARENGLKSCTRCHRAHIRKEEHIILARKGLLAYP